MDIRTAAIYAKQGYKIFRDIWKMDDKPTKYIHLSSPSGEMFLDDDDFYYLLSLDDVISDDWVIFTVGTVL